MFRSACFYCPRAWGVNDRAQRKCAALLSPRAWRVNGLGDAIPPRGDIVLARVGGMNEHAALPVRPHRIVLQRVELNRRAAESSWQPARKLACYR